VDEADDIPPLLRLTDIAKHFGGVRALRGVSFDLRPGEVHAVIGENGAGKSTLIKTIAGAHATDSGTIEIAGTLVERNTPALARSMGVAVVYQQPSLFPDLTVAENIALRAEPPRAWRWVRWAERRARAADLLARVGAGSVSPDATVRELSMPQQQLVEIAAALGTDVRVLILDEPTASLGEREADNLIAVVGRLRTAGIGIIYISHRLSELPRVADRVTVLRDGAHVATREMAGIDRAELIRLMVGREVAAVFPPLPAKLGNLMLECRGLGCRASGVHDVDLTVRAGEIVGLAGLVGAGRTELARVLFGLTPADAGDVRIDGLPVRMDAPPTAIAAGLAYVPEDRRRHGVILDFSVSANATLAVLRSIANGGLIDGAAERQLAERYVEQLSVKTPSVDVAVGTLSGGNQQKVAVARWLATRPRVIILDEPTQGVDVGAKAELYRVIAGLAEAGLAVLLISSELPEVLGLSHRVLVMRGGTIVGELAGAAATGEAVMGLAFGHATTVAA
jgi:rhamnose transport system ATP-binding protein